MYRDTQPSHCCLNKMLLKISRSSNRFFFSKLQLKSKHAWAINIKLVGFVVLQKYSQFLRYEIPSPPQSLSLHIFHLPSSRSYPPKKSFPHVVSSKYAFSGIFIYKFWCIECWRWRHLCLSRVKLWRTKI